MEYGEHMHRFELYVHLLLYHRDESQYLFSCRQAAFLGDKSPENIYDSI